MADPIYINEDEGIEWGEWLPTLPEDLDALTDRQVAVLLTTAISAISEEWWCAIWLNGVEFIAWDLGQASLRGDMNASPEEVATIARLKQRLNGAWVMWMKSADEEGVYLVDAETWEQARVEWTRAQAEWSAYIQQWTKVRAASEE